MSLENESLPKASDPIKYFMFPCLSRVSGGATLSIILFLFGSKGASCDANIAIAIIINNQIIDVKAHLFFISANKKSFIF